MRYVQWEPKGAYSGNLSQIKIYFSWKFLSQDFISWDTFKIYSLTLGTLMKPIAYSQRTQTVFRANCLIFWVLYIYKKAMVLLIVQILQKNRGWEGYYISHVIINQNMVFRSQPDFFQWLVKEKGTFSGPGTQSGPGTCMVIGHA